MVAQYVARVNSWCDRSGGSRRLFQRTPALRGAGERPTGRLRMDALHVRGRHLAAPGWL